MRHGVARSSGTADCAFAVTVSAEWQRKGPGAASMGLLTDAARARLALYSMRLD